MNIETLPPEILENIFKKLTGREVVSCRDVCIRWRGIIDAFTDCTWEEYCRRDFQSPQPVNRANLSYKELYNSLTLWDKVEDAELRITDLPLESKVNIFHAFNNQLAVATIAQSRVLHRPNFSEFSDTINYYNLATLEFVSCKRYPFLFKDYEENENIIVMVDDSKSLHITVKADDKETVYDSYDDIDNNFPPQGIIANTDYVYNANRVVCVAKLKHVDGGNTIDINIFKKPFKDNGDVISNNQKPNRSIQVTRSYKFTCELPGIQKLEVVEILNGHRVIFLADYKLAFCDLIHEQKKDN